ncbi:acylphosphatase [Kineobactrum salinum]|uniref:acylphosphatase n=1 Tax=Kineobactrum salinum TaxID=2708301 RepID=A0A6C0U4Y5_9GAMM|nr:acylphosphatase [Kineobactrum salinum]QIB66479.1 acylphosphatase [Kineobactrum salinum]
MATTGESIQRRLVISGTVQGVSYRAWMAAAARTRGLAGWVRNRRDGTVEAVVSGPADAVSAMVRDCYSGPSAARVSAVHSETIVAPDVEGFQQRPTV